MDRLHHLQNLLNRYQVQIQGLETTIVAAEGADRARLKQQLEALREELHHYAAEYQRLNPGEGPGGGSPGAAEAQARPLWEPPTGSIALDSPFYGVRDADRQGLRLIRGQGMTLSITGSRQVGKSSLLIRICEAARAVGKRVALLDLQSWDQQALQDATIFYRRLCLQLTLELGLANRVEAHWRDYGKAGESYACSVYVQDWLLGALAQPLVIALDEVEMLIDSPFRSEFFGMLRSWHNARATKAVLRPLDLVLVSSTEPYQLIADMNQSPFNVGDELKLRDFNGWEVIGLNQCYGNPLTHAELKALWRLVRGHPYLTSQALYQVASRRVSIDHLLTTAAQENGVFAGHLRHHRGRLEQRADLLAGMGLIAQGDGQRVARDVIMRLENAGLVRWDENGVVPRCGLYERYFRSPLPSPASVPARSQPEATPVSATDRVESQRMGSRGSNPWISGSFYLVVVIVVMTVVAVIGERVDWPVLVLVVITGLLTVVLVGIFQLRQDDRFSEANVLILVQETLKRLPLIPQTGQSQSNPEAKDNGDNQP